jgi:cytochrome P450
VDSENQFGTNNFARQNSAELAADAYHSGPASDSSDSVFDFCRSPQRFLVDLAVAGGPVAKFKINGEPFALLSDPELVHSVLNGNMRDYEKGALYDIPRTAFGDSIFTVDGEDWVALQSAIGPLFSRRRINELSGLINCLVDNRVAGWRGLRNDEDVDLLSATKSLAFEIIGRGLLGISHDRLLTELFEALSQIDRLEAVRLHFLAQRIPTMSGPFRPSAALFERIDQLIYRIVDEEISFPYMPGGLISGAMSSKVFNELSAEGKRRFIRDLIASMVTAGYVSTGESMFWALYLLARHPEAQSRARAEIHASGALTGSGPRHMHTDWSSIGSLPFFSAVLNESLRLYPPAWMIGRIAKTRVRLKGEDIQEGTRLICSPFVLHRVPELWPDPEEFRPERFLSGAKIPASSFIPFGSGARACLGRQVAMMEISSLVGAVIARFEVQALENSVSVAGAFSLQPRERVLFRLLQ